MARLRRTKCGKVLLKEEAPGRFRACFFPPGSKRYRRIWLKVPTWNQAVALAQGMNVELLAGNGFPVGFLASRSEQHPIKETVAEAIQASDANQQSKKDYTRRYNAFSNYLTAKEPDVAYWSHVDVSLLKRYLKHCRDLGLAHDSIRLRFGIIRLTAIYMARKYPDRYRNVVKDIVLKKKAPSKSEIELPRAVLSPPQLRRLLDWLKENDPKVHVWATLQGLCGMRLQEAAYIRERDIDFERRTLTIGDAGAHKPKNIASYRTLPVCDTVIQVLGEWIGKLKVRDPKGFLFTPDHKNPLGPKKDDPATKAGCFGVDRLCGLYRNALRRAKNAGIEFPPSFMPRKLRATFATAMRTGRADYADLQRYIGHSVPTVLSQHYDFASLDRLAEIAIIAQHLHDLTGPFVKKEQAESKTENAIG